MGLILPWAHALGHFPVTSEGISWVFLKESVSPILDISSAHPSLVVIFTCSFLLCSSASVPFLFAQRLIIIILKFACVPFKACVSLKGFPASLRRKKKKTQKKHFKWAQWRWMFWKAWLISWHSGKPEAQANTHTFDGKWVEFGSLWN